MKRNSFHPYISLVFCGNVLLGLLMGCDSSESEPQKGPSSTEKQEMTIEVSLPKRIHAVVGDDLQLFFRGIVGAVNPYNYDIMVNCDVGKKYPRYYTYTPTEGEIGEHRFTILVRDDNGKPLGRSETVIEVVDSVVSRSLHVLPFGDSLTARGEWCSHADSRLPDCVQFCGAKESGGTRYFGVGGWAWKDYVTAGRPALRFEVSNAGSLTVGSVYTSGSGDRYTIIEVNTTSGNGNILMLTDSDRVRPESPSGNLTLTAGTGDARINYSSFYPEAGNPLWSDGELGFRPYARKYADGEVDMVYVLLGWNELSPWQTDFTVLGEGVRRFCETLHRDYPGAKIGLLGLQIPSLNGGLGASYGSSDARYSDQYGLCRSVLNLNRYYEDLAEELGEYVDFINVSAQFDSEYNMHSEQTPVNKYNPATELTGSNGVHPNIYGYRQIGDAVYRHVCAHCAAAARR